MLHFADIFEAIADAIPNAPVITHGHHVVRWGEFDDQAPGWQRLAAHELGEGSKTGSWPSESRTRPS